MRPLLKPNARPLSRRRFQQWLACGAGSAAGLWPALAAAQGASAAATATASATNTTNLPARVVSVGGAITETLYALGAEHLLVGADTTSLYPAAATRLPSVGYARALSAEGVLSLRPTLLLAGAEAGPPAVMRQLAAARVNLLQLDADHRFEGLLQRTQQLGQAVGRESQAQALVATLNTQWQQAQARVQQAAAGRAGQPAPRVLFVLSHALNQVRVAGQDTAADAMLRYAGLHNVMGDVRGYKPLTPEAAIAAAPDIVLVTHQGLDTVGGVAGVLKAPGLAVTPAGRHQRVVAMEALWLLGFGPRLPQAVAHLAELCQRAMAGHAARATA